MWLFGLLAALLIAAALLITLPPVLKTPRPKALRLLQQARAAGIISAEEFAAKHQQLVAGQPAATRPPRLLAVLLLLAIPAATLLLYFEVGTPQALNADNHSPVSGAAGVQQLRAALDQHPDDLEGWLLLGNTLAGQQRYDDAIPAYQQALSLIPETRPERAVVMADIAEAIIFASGSQQVPVEARQYLQQAVAIDPQLQRGLWLLGVVAFQDQDYAQAIQRWQQLLPLLDNGSVSQSVREQIAQAQARLDGAPAAAPVSEDPAGTSADNVSITVEVALADDLRRQLEQQPGSPVLFVFARVAGSQQPPIAIQRLPLATLPITVQLTAADAMLPGNSLASIAVDTPLIITARVSFTGNAMAQPGDWEGQSDTSLAEQTGVLPLVIDQTITNP